ncbi:hypothetical protein DM860_013992 [Cuscuta australis]|uniref:Uncharacterized protein n=1 Tax=Cuscuta australis TaxID=267555 RepID=A0A328DQZ6_9ASTE|nr:hypothetical protein DM860_013992 [Cuscuta australis]
MRLRSLHHNGSMLGPCKTKMVFKTSPWEDAQKSGPDVDLEPPFIAVLGIHGCCRNGCRRTAGIVIAVLAFHDLPLLSVSYPSPIFFSI